MFFPEWLQKVRVREGTNELIQINVRALPDVYESCSHFVRCALNAELRRANKLKAERGVE